LGIANSESVLQVKRQVFIHDVSGESSCGKDAPPDIMTCLFQA
jgi:hypothetical protein